MGATEHLVRKGNRKTLPRNMQEYCISQNLRLIGAGHICHVSYVVVSGKHRLPASKIRLTAVTKYEFRLLVPAVHNPGLRIVLSSLFWKLNGSTGETLSERAWHQCHDQKSMTSLLEPSGALDKPMQIEYSNLMKKRTTIVS